MAHNPVGAGQSIATSGAGTTTSAFAHQTDSIRIVAVTKPVHVKIGDGNSPASHTDYYIPADTSAVLSTGRPSSAAVVGVTTGLTTTIDFLQGTTSPFEVGDRVSLTVSGQSYLDFTHKSVASVDTSADVGGYFSSRITVTHDSSGITTSFSATSGKAAELRGSFKVSSRTDTGVGILYAQQVQISGVQ